MSFCCITFCHISIIRVSMKFIIKDLLIIFELFFYIFRNFKYIKDKKFCLVTASDSNHYDYLINLIHNYEKKNNSKYFSNLIVFDIGMTNDQTDSLSKYNSLELRKFPFDEFPSFFKQTISPILSLIFETDAFG